jgi:hypothetical protein
MKKAAASALAAAMAVMSVASVAMADGYGSAGCGLGSIVFGDKPGMIQVLAATTNSTFYTQTFGITSGTSNCADAEPSVESAKAFVETNREALAKDAARGKGETISSLTMLAGCADAAAVGATLQSSFSTIFPEASVSDQQIGQSVLDTLKAHPELSCKQLG